MFTGTLIGNVGADGELKYLENKLPVLNFRVASSRKVKGKEETTWVNVAYFGKGAEAVSGYVTKGKQVAVTGEVYNRQYEKDGQTKYSLEINAQNLQLLGGKSESVQSATPVIKSSYVADETLPF